MLEFKTKEELQNCKELQKMGRYQWQTVMLNGKEVIACSTNQQYEDIIWGGVYELLEKISKYYEREIDSVDIASDVRDYILEILENEGIEFVDVYDEY